jgi:GxxExxY protein
MEPQMNADERGLLSPSAPINDLSREVIGAAMRVHNTLGCGFLEKVYENALIVELAKANIEVEQQLSIQVIYEGIPVGDYLADLVVDRRIIIELKAVKAIDEIHVAQTINYLRAANYHLGLILNFAKPKLEVKRLVHKL